MIVGVAASGKTTLSLKLAQQLNNSAYLSKDLIQSAFTRKERLEGEIYTMVHGPSFHILVDFCAVQLDLGKIPIIDAPFSINHWRNDEFSDWISFFKTVATQKKARLAIIRCLPPNLEELKFRIKHRGYAWDQWKMDHWEEFLGREPVDFPINHDDLLEIFSDQPVENMVNHICINYLSGIKVDKNN